VQERPEGKSEHAGGDAGVHQELSAPDYAHGSVTVARATARGVVPQGYLRTP
jgi:hypothetical protein